MELSPKRRACDVHRLIAGVANPFARMATFWPRSTRYPFDYGPKRSRLSQKVLPNMKIIAKHATFCPRSTKCPFDYGPKGNQLQKSAPICKVITKQATFWPRSTRYPFDYRLKGNQLPNKFPPLIKFKQATIPAVWLPCLLCR